MNMDDERDTVFVVDDAPEVRQSLSRLLGLAGYRVQAFESAELFLNSHDVNVAGCLLLDVWMPGLSGPDLQHFLASSGYARPIVFLTGQGDIQTSVHAMKEGAVDFLIKPVDDVRLFAAVEEAVRRDGQQRMKQSIFNTIQQRLEVLTPRERQVLMHVIRGRLNKQIAADLGTGEKTVKVHRARVMSKMMVRSVAELVQLCAQVGVSIEPTRGGTASSLYWKKADSPGRGDDPCFYSGKAHDSFGQP
jgi:FixJ family two-component response regulator